MKRLRRRRQLRRNVGFKGVVHVGLSQQLTKGQQQHTQTTPGRGPCACRRGFQHIQAHSTGAGGNVWVVHGCFEMPVQWGARVQQLIQQQDFTLAPTQKVDAWDT